MKKTTVDFGLLLPFRNPKKWEVSFPQLYQEHIEQAVVAEELGYDHIWTTEHHFAEDAWSPSLLPIISAMAMKTKQTPLNAPPTARSTPTTTKTRTCASPAPTAPSRTAWAL